MQGAQRARRTTVSLKASRQRAFQTAFCQAQRAQTGRLCPVLLLHGMEAHLLLRKLKGGFTLSIVKLKSSPPKLMVLGGLTKTVTGVAAAEFP